MLDGSVPQALVLDWNVSQVLMLDWNVSLVLVLDWLFSHYLNLNRETSIALMLYWHCGIGISVCLFLHKVQNYLIRIPSPVRPKYRALYCITCCSGALCGDFNVNYIIQPCGAMRNSTHTDSVENK